LTRSDKLKTIVGDQFIEYLTYSDDFVCYIPEIIHHYLLLRNENIEIVFDNETEFMTWNDEQQMEFIVTHPLLLSLHPVFDYMISKMVFNIKHKNRHWWIEKLALVCNLPYTVSLD
jgi:hypothetical protein